MKSNVFIDSNLWIYAFIESKSDSSKRETMIHFLENLNQQSNIIVSIQVINEFHWILKRKYKIDENRIISKVNNGILKLSNVSSISINTYKRSCDIRNKYHISFWDSIISVCP
ncbi:MAG: PIN domain-containing protein [Candidatus Cloacimonetes bacterium]|nr:PIN domain-containing protein [Candidatus Cloacimonadota bacterium]